MTCRASLNAKVASQLTQFLVLDWVMEDGGSVRNIQGVTIEPQRIFIDTTTRSLVFDPLNSTHEASYKCEAKLILPDFESFNTSMLYIPSQCVKCVQYIHVCTCIYISLSLST